MWIDESFTEKAPKPTGVSIVLQSPILRDQHFISYPLFVSFVPVSGYCIIFGRKAFMAPAPADSKRIEEARKLAKSDPSKAEVIYKDVLSKGPGTGEAALREYETALMGLGELYRDQKKPNELSELVTTSRSTLSSFAKAKTAKLGMMLVFSIGDFLLTIGSSPAA